MMFGGLTESAFQSQLNSNDIEKLRKLLSNLKLQLQGVDDCRKKNGIIYKAVIANQRKMVWPDNANRILRLEKEEAQANNECDLRSQEVSRQIQLTIDELTKLESENTSALATLSKRKDELELLIEAGNSTREIAVLLSVSQTSLRRFMAKEGLTTKHNPYGTREHLCDCGEKDPANFYGNDKRQCKICHGKMILDKYRENKSKAVALYGGKCKNPKCGLDKVPALEFHHRDGGETKDKAFGGKFGWAWDRLQKELEKCILLCSNCHKLIHAGELILTENDEFIEK